MFKTLKYSVTFPSTGRTLQRELDLTKGLTQITGANEQGKSFVIEMMRFALFGTSALRGTSEDYKTLQLTAEFDLRGENYRVERQINKAKLWRNQELVATGVKPVNQKLLSSLGFGLDVFDISCVTNQGDVERLGNMLPAERKRMVDQVIGVDRIDTVTKWVSEQASLAGKEIEVLEKHMGSEPQTPVAPEDLQPIPDLEGQLVTLKEQQQLQSQLKGWLSVGKPEPKLPVEPDVPSAAVLNEQLAQINAWEVEYKRIKTLQVIDFDPEQIRLEWDLFDQAGRRAAFERDNPRASITRETAEEQIALHGKLKEQAVYTAKLEQLGKAPHADCPHCQTRFSLEHQAIADYKFLLTELGNLPQPSLSLADLADQVRRIDNWDRDVIQKTWAEVSQFPLEAARPQATRESLARAAGAVHISVQDKMLFDLGARPDRTPIEQALRTRQAYEAAKHIYDRDIGPYDAWMAEKAVKENELAKLQLVDDALAHVERQLKIARDYEMQLTMHQKAHAAWTATSAVVSEKRVELEGWKQARLFLVEMRSRIKTYLVPSLSKVASWLLTRMTGGQRNSIVVDENFEVTVDGQPLGTLSGSGKACANLALRLGLGQVLTNNVFPVFIGDEIDASMDDDRAQKTQDSLGLLVDRISQIILITHKSPSAGTILEF
ncbi:MULTISPECIES: AAA family ATPase [unclassified Beijerinckia]|uniref:AAA family ATPase n=1 Tax=unclassified Beijerinckia TaxID=2638183 RepID=UPI00089AB3D5|nr:MULTISPECIES: AAA family ATPase [unclassified Beijerinckia]MDH7796459.1 exonuclease SbcC [Beijerinckia sp. GAS462]SEC45994.1 AAA domain-containing protein [Beijerinckia sp. 28-YEA-48]